MAQTLVLYAPGVITNPLPNHPRVPDISRGLLIDLDPRAATQANNEQVSNLIAGGSAPLAERTFRHKRLSPTVYPTLLRTGGPNGRPCLSFNGSANLANGSTSDGFPPERSGPTSYAIVAKIDTYPAQAGHSHRLIAPAGPDTAIKGPEHTIQPSQTNRIAAASWATDVDGPLGGNGAEYTYFTPSPLTGWFAGVVVFDGATSIACWGGPASRFVTGRGSYLGVSLGSQQAGSVTNGLIGRIARLQVFDRALTMDDAEALHAALSQEYGL